MAVYSFGSNPQVWAKPIAGGISAYRKAKAAEELAAKKAAKEAQAIYEKARKDREKAKKDAIKAQEEADKSRTIRWFSYTNWWIRFEYIRYTCTRWRSDAYSSSTRGRVEPCFTRI